jgi:hypothetical protein
MSWINILKQNDKIIETNTNKVNNDQEIQELDIQEDTNILDIDNEFDKIYFNTIVDIKLEFNDYIKDQCLPFLNKMNLTNYSFYDFIKYNSVNYDKLFVKIEKEIGRAHV